jgi:hypothetical protein
MSQTRTTSTSDTAFTHAEIHHDPIEGMTWQK